MTGNGFENLAPCSRENEVKISKKRKMAKNQILRSDLDETTSFNSYGQRIRSSELQNCHCRYVVIAQIVRKTMGSQCNGGKW